MDIQVSRCTEKTYIWHHLVDDIFEVNEEPQFVADPYLPQTTEQTDIQQRPSTLSSNPPSCSTVIEPLPNYPICELTNVEAFKNFPLLQSAAKLYNQFERRQRNLVESYRSSLDAHSQQVNKKHEVLKFD
jgi:hypothetical protein